MEPTILVHGGAGKIEECMLDGVIQGIKSAALEGYRTLLCTGSVVQAVESAVNVLEDDKHFNAGIGSALTCKGDVEMESSIMVGKDMSAGGVAICKDIAHPISVARLVAEKTNHVILADEGVKQFAASNGVPILASGSLVTEKAKEDLEKFKKTGAEFMVHAKGSTVGAVAIDKDGNIAAATSTGGLTGKMPGRIGDSSQIGGGTYADNAAGGVSCTGFGENIMRFALAHKICRDMEKGKSANTATKSRIEKLKGRLDSTAGAIAISRKGDVGVYFNACSMPWAYVRGDEIHFGVDKGQHEVECIKIE
ncbi:isoaspartyl peptidase/L-asparaginase-like [Agrilus planipennis]|uniref:Isoaspartyl peptidase/L-asparaginase-like n=1 Tax=Agrilus planipennis TaxID=224129 RepID=A0A1W4WPY1_AGRPL|nr:isoaspartyl peptidase/L-asparaginase-like [Agrilus planipennis]